MIVLQGHAPAAVWAMPESARCKTIVWHAAGFTDSIRPELADMGIHVAQVIQVRCCTYRRSGAVSERVYQVGERPLSWA